MRFPIVLALFAGLPSYCQENLSLRSAVELALHQSKSLAASQASEREAEIHIRQARAGMLPKVNYTESLSRSNNPVFVFGSLLTQHQFKQDNFELNALNRPGFLDNFQSSITAEQIIFDGGKTRNEVRSASSLREAASEDDRQARVQTIFNVAKAYFDAALSREALAASDAAVKSAEADLAHAEEIRRVGMSTDADVLSIRVHLAQVRERKFQGEADVAVAQAVLDDALSVPLDVTHDLSTPFKRAKLPTSSLEDLEHSAMTHRPEQLRMNYAVSAASSRLASARSSLLPVISVRGAFEEDREDFLTRGGPNWSGSVALSWNILNGGGDKARIAEASESVARTEAERDRTISSVRLDVRRAWENLRAADQQVDVSQNAIAEAAESLRITKNRYEAGLSTVTDLLRTESAVLESRMQYLTTLHDQRLAAIVLDAATGTLSVDSPAIQE